MGGHAHESPINWRPLPRQREIERINAALPGGGNLMKNSYVPVIVFKVTVRAPLTARGIAILPSGTLDRRNCALLRKLGQFDGTSLLLPVVGGVSVVVCCHI